MKLFTGSYTANGINFQNNSLNLQVSLVSSRTIGKLTYSTESRSITSKTEKSEAGLLECAKVRYSNETGKINEFE